jgi:putative FmdB family regulatory protein
MPIYEYKAVNLESGCMKCQPGFEVIQGMDANPLSECPNCGQRIRKLVSRCYLVITEKPEESIKVGREIKEFEKAGRWSHAAELADTYSEKIGNKELKSRALDAYKKAGYPVDSWIKPS